MIERILANQADMVNGVRVLRHDDWRRKLS
jgi:hypothetical protein